jgi:predicted AlkP superfamily phosphohydrolase/phosphomutase
MEKVARPEPVVRFHVEGQEVDELAFWEAVREQGGRAIVTTHPPAPPRGELRYRLTPAGAAALRQEQEAGQ